MVYWSAVMDNSSSSSTDGILEEQALIVASREVTHNGYSLVFGKGEVYGPSSGLDAQSSVGFTVHKAEDPCTWQPQDSTSICVDSFKDNRVTDKEPAHASSLPHTLWNTYSCTS